MNRPQFVARRGAIIVAFCALVGLLSTRLCQAQVTVWVDFTSDIHNGAASGPNGTADWIHELAKATLDAGVTVFTDAERASIEADILSQLATIYADYDVTFTTTMPASGVFDAIAYGRNSFGFGSLGEADTDPTNIASSQVAGIATGNFGFILDEFTGVDSRATQMSQIATALAGTGAHELGHTFGLMHQHAYSDPSITPATYGATGGAQNAYMMATGPTGLDEAEREVIRGFSPWEKAMFDVAGGASAAYTGPLYHHQKLVTTPIMIDLTEDGPFDVGMMPPAAMPLMLIPGETSGMNLAVVAGDLDLTDDDVDMFKFFLPRPSVLTAEIFSSNRFEPPFNFDPVLILSSPGGVIASNDDVFFDGDVYDGVTFRENDPYLLNIPLMPGEYFLLVHASPMSSVPPMPGDAYWLMVGATTVPEPTTVGLLAVMAGVTAVALCRSSFSNSLKLRNSP
jgi:hypothetical protein